MTSSLHALSYYSRVRFIDGLPVPLCTQLFYLKLALIGCTIELGRKLFVFPLLTLAGLRRLVGLIWLERLTLRIFRWTVAELSGDAVNSVTLLW